MEGIAALHNGGKPGLFDNTEGARLSDNKTTVFLSTQIAMMAAFLGRKP